MRLIGMLNSPYVRRVAVALIVAKVPFEHRPISLFRHIDAFAKINPLLKAPTLVTDNGVVLMDSGVILDYLTAAYPRVAALTPPDVTGRLRALRATALGLTMMEKAVQRHYERLLRPAEKRHDPWVERVMGQLLAGLSALDAEAPQSGWTTGNSASPTSLWLAPTASCGRSWRTSSRRAGIRAWRNFATAPRHFPLFEPRRRKTA